MAPIIGYARTFGGGGGGTPTISATSALANPGSSTGLTINVPTHSSGDLLRAYVVQISAHDDMTDPSGWTRVQTYTNNDGFTGDLCVYHRTAGASEPASYSWTSGTSSLRMGLMETIQNAGGTFVWGTKNVGFGTTITAPSITATADGIVSEHYLTSGSITKTGGTEYNNGYTWWYYISNEGVSAGATGDQTATGPSGHHLGVQFEVEA